MCLSTQMLWVWIPLRHGVLDAKLCDKVCQWLAAGLWFSPGTPVSFTDKAERHNISGILLNVVLYKNKNNIRKLYFDSAHNKTVQHKF
jgi:hypothetical protein